MGNAWFKKKTLKCLPRFKPLSLPFSFSKHVLFQVVPSFSKRKIVCFVWPVFRPLVMEWSLFCLARKLAIAGKRVVRDLPLSARIKYMKNV
ncbi:hypothetical protein ACROYT_G004336 [Oculina patagonica]